MSSQPVPRGAAYLTDKCFFRLTGSDRVRYLNGQVTQDVLRMAAGETRHSCVTDAKGRIQAEVWITWLADSLLIDGPLALRAALGERLERYIIADDVEVHDETGRWQLAHLLGVAAGERAWGDEVVVARSERFGVDGLDVVGAGPLDQLVGLERLEPEVVDELRIRRGIPVWGRELDERTLPAEAGLEARSVSFNKGCYIGQEVISRVRSAGKTNRMLVKLELGAGLPADLSGAQLWDAASTPERPAGWLTSWTGAGPARAALGYVRRDAAGAIEFGVRLADGTMVAGAARRQLA